MSAWDMQYSDAWLTLYNEQTSIQYCKEGTAHVTLVFISESWLEKSNHLSCESSNPVVEEPLVTTRDGW